MRLNSTGRLALLLVLALAAPWTAPVAQEPPAPQTPVQELPGTGPAQEPPVEPLPETEQAAEPAMSCADCHEISQQFVLNPHAKGTVENGVVPNGTCETCHGDGTAHMEAGGDPALIAVPRGRGGAHRQPDRRHPHLRRPDPRHPRLGPARLPADERRVRPVSGGISIALVTTELGLVVAIPMVLIHTLVSGQSRKIINIINSQSAGIVAQHSERHG